MDNLPVEISSDILSRLPAGAVFECQLVCKTWRDLLLSSCFSAIHLLRNNQDQCGIGSSKVSSTLAFIFLVKSETPKSTCHSLYYGEFITDHNDQCSQNVLRPINHTLLPTGRKSGASALVGSCNGLICFVETGKYGVKDPIHICNPVTRECVYLQKFNKNCEHNSVNNIKIYSGFGYSLKTKEYKVVRIVYSNGFRRGDIQVYTLGAGSGWRNKGVITEKLHSPYGVFFDGALYWFQAYSGGPINIMVFDLSDEAFHDIQGPVPDRTYKDTYILRSFGEWLCVGGEYHRCSSTCLDIWTYKKTTLDKRTAATYNKDKSWIWCKEFSIRVPYYSSIDWRNKPVALTKNGLVILEHYDGHDFSHHTYRDARTLFCYDPQTATMKPLGTWNFFEAIPHTNSFASLKALGETTCKKRERRPTSSIGAERLACLISKS